MTAAFQFLPNSVADKTGGAGDDDLHGLAYLPFYVNRVSVKQVAVSEAFEVRQSIGTSAIVKPTLHNAGLQYLSAPLCPLYDGAAERENLR